MEFGFGITKFLNVFFFFYYYFGVSRKEVPLWPGFISNLRQYIPTMLSIPNASLILGTCV